MKTDEQKTKASEAEKKTTGRLNVTVKEISFDENSPALLKKKREAQALLQGIKTDSR